MPPRTVSLDLFELEALLNDQIQTWSHLLPSESPSASTSNSPLVWNQKNNDVPLLKPAIPKSFNSLDAKLILSSVEENLRDDALDDWEPFSDNYSAVSPGSSITRAFSNAESIARSTATFKSPVRGHSGDYKVVLSPYNYDLDEGTRLSTPLDWKPLHPLDPSSPFHEWGLKRSEEVSERSSYNFALSDDHLISQGDAARARRKRRQNPVLEIPAELIARRDTVQIVNLLKKRGIRFQAKDEPEGSVPELPPLPPPKSW